MKKLAYLCIVLLVLVFLSFPFLEVSLGAIPIDFETYIGGDVTLEVGAIGNTNIELYWPVSDNSNIECVYGDECYTNHNGIDIGVNEDGTTPIYSASNGTVVAITNSCKHLKEREVGCGSGFGNYVKVKIANEELYLVYAHLAPEINFKVGDNITIGDLVGFGSNSGNTCGYQSVNTGGCGGYPGAWAHLHFEIQDSCGNPTCSINPTDLFVKSGNSYVMAETMSTLNRPTLHSPTQNQTFDPNTSNITFKWRPFHHNHPNGYETTSALYSFKLFDEAGLIYHKHVWVDAQNVEGIGQNELYTQTLNLNSQLLDGKKAADLIEQKLRWELSACFTENPSENQTHLGIDCNGGNGQYWTYPAIRNLKLGVAIPELLYPIPNNPSGGIFVPNGGSKNVEFRFRATKNHSYEFELWKDNELVATDKLAGGAPIPSSGERYFIKNVVSLVKGGTNLTWKIRPTLHTGGKTYVGKWESSTVQINNSEYYPEIPPKKNGAKPVYRLRDPYVASYLFTIHNPEKDTVTGWETGAFAYEGTPFYAYTVTNGACPNKDPIIIYRYRNFSGTFLYTSYKDEAKNLAGWTFEGEKFCAFTKSAPGRYGLYRMYNPATGAFLLSNSAERNSLVASGWQQQGNGPLFYAETSEDFDLNGVVPVHRMYSESGGAHLLTASGAELDSLLVLPDKDWIHEGIAFYTPRWTGSFCTDGVPVYRFRRDNGTYFFTLNKGEGDAVSSMHYEGIAFCGLTNDDPPGLIPVYRLTSNGVHFFTTSAHERQLLQSNGWTYEGEVFYVYATADSYIENDTSKVNLVVENVKNTQVSRTGQQNNYQFTIRNGSGRTSLGTKVEITIPNTMSFEKATFSKWDCTNTIDTNIVCEYQDAINPNETVAFGFYTITQSTTVGDTQYGILAKVVTPGEEDNNPANNRTTMYTRLVHESPVYRFLNTDGGSYLFTIYEHEAQAINGYQGWASDGKLFYAYKIYNDSCPVDTVPLYRFNKKDTAVYIHTTAENEKNTILGFSDWNFEGAKFCVYKNQQPGTDAVTRIFDSQNYRYGLSNRQYEVNQLVGTGRWNNEGVKFFAKPYGHHANKTLRPVFRMYDHSSRHSYLFTANVAERDNVLILEKGNWSAEGVAWFSPYEQGGTCAAGVKVHRFWDNKSTAWYYNVNSTLPGSTWKHDGGSFCGFTTQVAGTQGVRQLFHNADPYKHLFTIYDHEYFGLSSPWKREGTAFYAYPAE